MNDDKENHNSISASQFLNKIFFRGTFIKHFIFWQEVAIILGVK